MGRSLPARAAGAAILSATLTLTLPASLVVAAPKPAPAVKGPAPTIDRIEIRLLYETTGVLSDNIAPPATFFGWNTVIAAGDAKEPANDLLVHVHLAVPGDEANVDLPLQIRAVDGRGKTLASRTFRALFFKKGRSVQALLVPNATCAGALKVEASIGRERKATSVRLECGE